ncbi:MAG: DNA mismatch repair protein MutS [Planctomycetes bacterium]|nr:DNA mismatch repair protein MutS [Planctomycetota bacterium]
MSSTQSPKSSKEPTPMMRQFHAAKDQHPNALLFFRMGDFYELFYDDAKIASKELGLTLTARDKERKVPMAGIPVRSLEGYLARLVRAGHTVAICEQLQDPREVKGIVERGVVRVVSPGTLLEEESLVGSEPLFVLAIHVEVPRGKAAEKTPLGQWPVGLSWADLTTGAFRCCLTDVNGCAEELGRIQPAEILLADIPENEEHAFVAASHLKDLIAQEGIPQSVRMPWTFDERNGRRDLCAQLKVSTLEAFGIEEIPPVIASCGALLDFLRDTQKSSLQQLRELHLHQATRHLALDRATRRTLEIVRNQHDGGREGTLLAILDRTGTPMGARLLRDWVLEPLVNARDIRSRHDAVGELLGKANQRREIATALDGLGDLERLAAKLISGRAGARDLSGLARALERVPSLRGQIEACDSDALSEILDSLDTCADVAERIRGTLLEELPLSLKDGGLIQDGFHTEVDELRALAKGGKDYLIALQERESERVGFPVKLGFNRVFGYYIEITRLHSDKAPDDYIRKQTLKNAERFITPELKEYEGKVLSAEDKVKELEYLLFEELRNAVMADALRIIKTARAIAELDVLQGLASVASERRYVRPEFVEAPDDQCGVLDIREGRHPVVEAALSDDPFVPNDTLLGVDPAAEEGAESSRLAILTGPNMSGKSTYLRQTAMVVLLAQMGSFVPAESARLTLVDRIFTRLGGGDDISRGQSTFMVEMVETANILRHATPRSLLLLDEVGRGTSTFDGLAIAWAVCEFVHDRAQARCLFATHYHQLTDLANQLTAATNLNVAVREWGEEIVFLHRIEEGGTDRSYGIHVGQLAGLPQSVLSRAQVILEKLERDEEGLSRRILQGQSERAPAEEPQAVVHQPGLFDMLSEDSSDTLLGELLDTDLDNLPPIEAWQLLARVLQQLRDRQR